jgi:hypothetical protein
LMPFGKTSIIGARCWSWLTAGGSQACFDRIRQTRRLGPDSLHSFL